MLALLASLTLLLTGVAARSNYCMYVWTDGWDSSVAGCTSSVFQTWSSNNNPCFTHNWNTTAKRQQLWDTCDRPNREIADIYVSGVTSALRSGFNSQSCGAAGISTIQDMLREGHSQVQGLKIWALYADSDVPVSEQFKIQYVAWYNDQCAASSSEKFDGVAVNNEAWNTVKSLTAADKQTYLTNLANIPVEAAKQVSGTLRTHFSIGWSWSRYYVVWGSPAVNKTVTEHMVDIFDSFDFQVAWYSASTMANRAVQAGYNQAVAAGKDTCILAYLNKASPCYITFFPETNCSRGQHSEAAMFSVFDDLPNYNMSRGGIHYFRGVYASGGHVDWPIYTAPVTLAPPGEATRVVTSWVATWSLLAAVFIFHH